MIDGVKSFRVMIRNAVTEEIREYTLPVDAGNLAFDLVSWIAEMQESRPIGRDAFAGTLQSALSGTPGWVGEYLEIRKLMVNDA